MLIFRIICTTSNWSSTFGNQQPANVGSKHWPTIIYGEWATPGLVWIVICILRIRRKCTYVHKCIVQLYLPLELILKDSRRSTMSTWHMILCIYIWVALGAGSVLMDVLGQRPALQVLVVRISFFPSSRLFKHCYYHVSRVHTMFRGHYYVSLGPGLLGPGSVYKDHWYGT